MFIKKKRTYRLAYFAILVNQSENKTKSFLKKQWNMKVIYEALCFDAAQGRMNGAPNETQTHSCRFASQAC